MPPLPYVIQSCALSLDGYIDDTSSTRLILSNPEDFDQVDALRAECDAILVGAQTIRADNPSLEIRSPQHKQQRLNQGKPESLLKVTLTTSGNLNPQARFFTTGTAPKLVYCPHIIKSNLEKSLAEVAEVIEAGPTSVDYSLLLSDLAKRGVKRLLIEAGSTLSSSFLAAGLVDELRLAIAPFFVGEAKAARFVKPGMYPHNKNNPMKLVRTEKVGDMVILIYKLNS